MWNLIHQHLLNRFEMNLVMEVLEWYIVLSCTWIIAQLKIHFPVFLLFVTIICPLGEKCSILGLPLIAGPSAD